MEIKNAKDGELEIYKPWVSFSQLMKDETDEPEIKSMVRMYKDSPSTALIQLRACTGLGWNGGGAKRNLIASAHLNKQELTALRNKIDEVLKKL